LISEIQGLNAANEAETENPEQLIRILAKGLRSIHSIYTGNCPIYHLLDKKITEAEDRVKNVFPKAGITFGFYSEKKAERLLEMLKMTKPLEEDLVFTHGDFVMPNIIINDNEISGFIDWGQGGIADRYQDLALVSRSIMYNLGSRKWVELFYNEYGLENLDRNKIRYYMMLDELFQN
jgi:aminoglycoside phosphotransferase